MTTAETQRAVVANLGEARAAIAAAQSSGAVAELESPPGAASIHGVLWFAEMNRMLAAEFPTSTFTLTLDCGDRADLAHAALVEGIKRIRFQGPAQATQALRDIAVQSGAELVEVNSHPDFGPPLYVIAELELAAADHAWIRAIRARNDPQFDLVAPHFTFVFGAKNIAPETLLDQTRQVAAITSAISIELCRVAPFREAATGQHYVFLVPDAGYDQLVSLHERLQRPHRKRVDDPVFAPHVTIGRFANKEDADALASTLMAQRPKICGRLTALQVIAVREGRIERLGIFPLRASASTGTR